MKMRAMSSFLLLFFAVPSLLLAGGAYANEPATRPATEATAMELFREGEVHYAAGRYAVAAQNFEQAYAISKRSQLLFNMGNAYERMGEFKKAADRLRLYLEAPDARGKQLVSERIGRLEAAHDQKERARQEAREAGQADPAPGKDPSVDGEGPSNLFAYVLLGVGGAAIATAVGLGFAANSAGEAAESNCAEGFCLEAAQSDLDRQKGFALASDISLGVGIAAVAAGAVWLVINLTSDEKPADQAQRPALWLSGAPNPGGGATFGLGGHF